MADTDSGPSRTPNPDQGGGDGFGTRLIRSRGPLVPCGHGSCSHAHSTSETLRAGESGYNIERGVLSLQIPPCRGGLGSRGTIEMNRDGAGRLHWSAILDENEKTAREAVFGFRGETRRSARRGTVLFSRAANCDTRWTSMPESRKPGGRLRPNRRCFSWRQTPESSTRQGAYARIVDAKGRVCLNHRD